jgi:hypothetical protein
MNITLTHNELSVLLRQVSGTGGFQSLLRRLKAKVNRQTGQLTLTAGDLEKIPRYAFDYGNGGWESRLRDIFGSHLGPNLGR